MLTLKNFEADINATILKRGSKYFRDGAVMNIEEPEAGKWEAEVEGTEDYSVEINLENNNQVTNSSCDCPFENPICKHVIAVLYAIKAKVENPEACPVKKSSKQSFQELLLKIKLKEYQEFIIQYASTDKKFKTEFEIYFSDKDDSIDSSKKYSDLIRNIVKKNSDRGFADYQATSRISNEINKLLATGNQLIHTANFKDAFALSKSLLKGCVDIITYCDDSSGRIGDSIDGTMQLIETIIQHEKVAIDLKKEIFIFLEKELANPNYFDYGDFGYDLFSSFRQLSIMVGETAAFTKFIDNALSKLTGKEDTYRRNFFQTEKIAFLKDTGKEEEAKVLILQNLNIVSVRQGEVDRAIRKKDFPLAKQFITDGIKIAQKDIHPGTVTNWEKELLRIAFLEKDTDQVRFFTKKLAFDRWFNKEYYKQWKATFSKSEWKQILEALIAEKTKGILNEKTRSVYLDHSGLLIALAPIYIEESYWDRLLELVKKETRLDAILNYHTNLVKVYPSELLQIYLPALEAEANHSNGRSGYIHLAARMRKIIEDIPGGKNKIIAVAQKLIQKYSRRPAMVEELNKIVNL